MEDLHNSKIELWLEDVPFIKYYVPLANRTIDKKIYKNKLIGKNGKRNPFMKLPEGVALIKNGLNGKKAPKVLCSLILKLRILLAFISEDSRLYQQVELTFSEHEKCDLVNIAYLKESDPFLSIKKNSPYREMFVVK